jgi:ABC-type lipoprotein export system ATPase subunit
LDEKNNNNGYSMHNSKVNFVIIKGDAGCGKTALLNFFRDELGQMNRTILE